MCQCGLEKGMNEEAMGTTWTTLSTPQGARAWGLGERS